MALTHLEGLLCHCPATPEDGHPLGAPGCTSKVTSRQYAGYHHTNPDHSVMAAEILTELSRHNPARRDQLLRSASILRAAEREARAHNRCSRAYERVRKATEEAGLSPTKRQAAELLKAREALPVQLASARQLRWDSLL